MFLFFLSLLEQKYCYGLNRRNENKINYNGRIKNILESGFKKKYTKFSVLQDKNTDVCQHAISQTYYAG